MNAKTRTSLGKALAIFTGMAIVFAALLVAADVAASTLAQLVLVSAGSAVFGSGLTFFLVRATFLDDAK
jgi:hypothetical protein